MSFDTSLIDNAIERLRVKGTSFESGLTDREVADIESRFEFRFPPDLRYFLQSAFPAADFYVDWRSDDATTVKRWLRAPIDEILFDVRENGSWMSDWNEKPAHIAQAVEVAKRHLSAAPTLIPICGNIFTKYLPETPAETGNPIFSIKQTDALHAGRDLCDFLAWFSRPREAFDEDEGPPTPVFNEGYRKIPVWTELVRLNVFADRLEPTTPIPTKLPRAEN